MQITYNDRRICRRREWGKSPDIEKLSHLKTDLKNLNLQLLLNTWWKNWNLCSQFVTNSTIEHRICNSGKIESQELISRVWLSFDSKSIQLDWARFSPLESISLIVWKLQCLRLNTKMNWRKFCRIYSWGDRIYSWGDRIYHAKLALKESSPLPPLPLLSEGQCFRSAFFGGSGE